MSQVQTTQTGKEESFKVTTKEATKETKACSTPDELVGAIRASQAQGKTMVFATKDLIKFFTGDEKSFYFTMMGMLVCEEGKESAIAKEKSTTIEQVNFGKI